MVGYLSYMKITKQPVSPEEAEALEKKNKYRKSSFIIKNNAEKPLVSSEQFYEFNPQNSD